MNKVILQENYSLSLPKLYSLNLNIALQTNNKLKYNNSEEKRIRTKQEGDEIIAIQMKQNICYFTKKT